MAETVNNYDTEEFSSVRISDDAVAGIAALAATEVDGVAGMAGNITNEIIAKLGVRNLGRGVKIDINDNVISITLSIDIKYGYSIPAVSKNVQDKVKAMVENMTGLNVSEVRVNITGINAEN